MKKLKKRYLILIFSLLFILLISFIVYLRNDKSHKNVYEPAKKITNETLNTDDVELNNSKNIFYDPTDFTYKFVEDYNKLLVIKDEDPQVSYWYPKELGIYNADDETYETLFKTQNKALRFMLSPEKDYLLIADVATDPNPKYNSYATNVVKLMKIINLNTYQEISVPFPENRSFAGALWNLEKNKLYITASEGFEYSYKWYYEFNLKSGDFKLVATSDDLILDYNEGEKKIAHFITGLSGYDSSGNIIAIGQAPEDPHLFAVWRINPDSLELTKLYDYNIDE